MKTEILKEKLGRYLNGTAHPAEIKQVEAWLSSAQVSDIRFSETEREIIRQHILYEIQCHTAYPLFYPQKKNTFNKLKQFLHNFC